MLSVATEMCRMQAHREAAAKMRQQRGHRRTASVGAPPPLAAEALSAEALSLRFSVVLEPHMMFDGEGGARYGLCGVRASLRCVVGSHFCRLDPFADAHVAKSLVPKVWQWALKKIEAEAATRANSLQPHREMIVSETGDEIDWRHTNAMLFTLPGDALPLSPKTYGQYCEEAMKMLKEPLSDCMLELGATLGELDEQDSPEEGGVGGLPASDTPATRVFVLSYLTDSTGGAYVDSVVPPEAMKAVYEARLRGMAKSRWLGPRPLLATR